MSNFVRNYYPQRPVKSFQDLEVYQKLLAVSVAVAKRIGTKSIVPPSGESLRATPEEGLAKLPTNAKGTPRTVCEALLRGEGIGGRAVSLALNLPIKIATAHSLRFGDHGKSITTLEEVMLDCNLLIVYLEQYRDITNVPLPILTDIEDKVPAENCIIESEFFEEQIRTLLTCRFKVLHLQQSWKKFDKEKEEEK